MRKLGTVFISFCFLLSASSQNDLNPTIDILQYTFLLSKKDGSSGTGFVISYKENKYLVTAKHLFDTSTKSGDRVDINIDMNNQKKKIPSPVYFHSNPKIDIAVFKFTDSVSHVPPYDISAQPDQVLGGQVIFLGFPLGIVYTPTNRGKIPFLKKAYLSGWYLNSVEDFVLLDGHNNVGFSGGPALMRMKGSKKLAILGVVVAYLKDPKKIGPVGKEFIYDENSGIIACVPAHFIGQIIDQIPK